MTAAPGEPAGLRRAVASDIDFLQSFPDGPGVDLITAQISDGRMWIIEADQVSIGFIKSSVLWERLPFLEVIVIAAPQRRCGRGRAAVRAWENQMAARGFDLVLTSTQAGLSAQHFWRKLGYADCGALTVRGKPAEIFMQRSIALTASPA